MRWKALLLAVKPTLEKLVIATESLHDYHLAQMMFHICQKEKQGEGDSRIQRIKSETELKASHESQVLKYFGER